MRIGLPPAVLALAAALAAAPAAVAATVESGPLRAETQADPWHLAFVQDSVTLSEARGTGPGPTGTLGFRAAGVWRHATRVLSEQPEGNGYALVLATTDPAGRTLEARLAPDGDGVIRLEAAVAGGPTADVEAVGIAFEAAEGERYLGFGERSNAVDQRGNEIENYVAEGPYEDDERPFIAPFVPPWSYHPRDDATYFPMPWLLSTRGYGVLVENTQTSWFRLGTDSPGAWSLEAEAPRLALRVMAGPRPRDVVRRLTEHTGRQPEPFAPWFFGPWFQTGQANKVPHEEEMRYLSLLQDNDAPVSVAETHMRFLPCGAHEGEEDFERERTRLFHERGLAVLTYFQEKICVEYREAFDEARRRDVLLENQAGEDYLYNAYLGERAPPQALVGQIDFTAPGSFEFYGELLAQATSLGHDGWMEDFGEETPLDSQAANGMDGTEMHNLYPVPYHHAGFEFARAQPRPIARFIRSGWTGVHPYAQIVWGGDPSVDWGFDGLASAVKNGLTMGLSGISTWGSDIGGFHALGENQLTPELLIRWIQFGAVSPVMRTKAGGVAVPPKPRPQIWEPEIRPHWRRWAKLHTQLNPYLAAADAVYRRTGMPIMRHLALSFPGDRAAEELEDQFMFGPDLLAAPVLFPDTRERRLYLPAGRWVDLWRSASYDSDSGGIELGRARVLRGPGHPTLPAPLGQLPLLARAGAVIPLLPRDVDTLSDYGEGSEVVRLADRRGRMELLAFPRGRSSAGMGEGERLRSRERRGRWTLHVRGARKRTYTLQASLATLRRSLRPCAVRLRGRTLPRRRWSYDASERVLRVRFRVRTGTLAVLGRCAAAGDRGARRRGAPRLTG